MRARSENTIPNAALCTRHPRVSAADLSQGESEMLSICGMGLVTDGPASIGLCTLFVLKLAIAHI